MITGALPAGLADVGPLSEHRGVSWRDLGDRARDVRGDERGFTLIELLIVILIIAVLAEIAIPSFLGQAVQGQRRRRQVGRPHGADRDGDLPSRPRRLLRRRGREPGRDRGDAVCEAYGLTVNPCERRRQQRLQRVGHLPLELLDVFTVSVTDGATQRVCSTPGQGGCPPGGSW